MPTTIVVGSQWGDEGKGKLVDILASSSQFCMRAQGGHNAGHTIEANGVKYDFHILPSGLLNPMCVNLIGSGCVVYVPQFFHELETLQKQNINTKERIFISDRAHIILELHLKIDGLEEVELGKGNIGTTGKGIGPTYSTKMSRSGIRVAELFDHATLETKVRRLAMGFKKRFGDLLQYDLEDELDKLKGYGKLLADFVIDEVPFCRSAKGQKCLVEGANAIMLDIDHGTYPFVTSSSTGVGGVLTGLSLGWRSITDVVGVVKAYTTRVGSGPFPTEQLNESGNQLQEIGREFGVTTGRRRRTGWLDLVLLKYSHEVNDYTKINLTKLDVLDSFAEIPVAIEYKYNGKALESFPASLPILQAVTITYKTLQGWSQPTTGCKEWDDLPPNAKAYVKFVEEYVGVHVAYIGTGPKREDLIVR